MKNEKRVKEPVATPTEAASPKKVWQKPQIQQLRISLDTAGGMGSNTDGFGGSQPL